MHPKRREMISEKPNSISARLKKSKHPNRLEKPSTCGQMEEERLTKDKTYVGGATERESNQEPTKPRGSRAIEGGSGRRVEKG